MKYKYLLLLIVIVNSTALFSGIMEPDGALYAYVAKQMVQNSDFVNLHNNADWLDKPHLPFWIIAISFKIFGINSFAYKLPAFLFWLAGLAYLYKLGKVIYNKKTAIMAVIIYATALQATIGLFDVRAEHYLTALTIASIYYLYRLYNSGKLLHLLLAAIFSACAIMTKGMFTLIIIISGILTSVAVNKEWERLTEYKWYIYLLLTFIFILPELYCLYTQFDLHPEKVVYHKTNVSGLQFFFWDSQFGRFFNTGPIKGNGSPLFFFHTLLWAFLPWSILLYIAVIRLITKRSTIYKSEQWIVLGSLVVTFLMFSLSKTQLPHYVIILFPQCALLCADYLAGKAFSKSMTSIVWIQRLLLIICLFLVGIIAVVFGLHKSGWIISFAMLLVTMFLFFNIENDVVSAINLGAAFMIMSQSFLNLFFYPQLLHYQSGEKAAEWLNTEIKPPQVGLFKNDNLSFKFYVNSKIVTTDTLPIKFERNFPINFYLTTKENADSLTASGVPIRILKYFEDFHISKLKFAFINKRTRLSKLDSVVVFRLPTK